MGPCMATAGVRLIRMSLVAQRLSNLRCRRSTNKSGILPPLLDRTSIMSPSFRWLAKSARLNSFNPEVLVLGTWMYPTLPPVASSTLRRLSVTQSRYLRSSSDNMGRTVYSRAPLSVGLSLTLIITCLSAVFSKKSKSGSGYITSIPFTEIR